jgi:ASPIC and UnbV
VKSNHAALGTVVPLEQGGDKHEKEVRSGDGYISQSRLRLHFGLGKAVKAEKITIRWRSGLVETLSDLPANQYLRGIACGYHDYGQQQNRDSRPAIRDRAMAGSAPLSR